MRGLQGSSGIDTIGPVAGLEGVLSRQAAEAEEGFKALEGYANTPSAEAAARLRELSVKAERTGRAFLEQLEAAPEGGAGLRRSEAFMVSRALEEMLGRARAAVTEMMRFEIESDSLLRELARASAGMCRDLSEAIKAAASRPRTSSARLIDAKRAAKRVAQGCREASALALGGDAVAAMKARALYQHLAEAARRAEEAAERIGDAAARAS